MTNISHRQIADALRQQIAAGELAPGAMLPTETEIKQRYGCARNTVRQALSVLRAEGLIVTERPRGSRVRPPLAIRVMDLSADRYLRRRTTTGEKATPFTADLGQSTKQSNDLEFTLTRTEANEEVASHLQVPVGTGVLRRDFVFTVSGIAYQMSSSYLPLDLVKGSRICEDDKEIQQTGTVEQLSWIGVTVTRVTKRVRCRMPTQAESKILIVPNLTPVMCIKRVMWAGERPVEAALEIVSPGDRIEIISDAYLEEGVSH